MVGGEHGTFLTQLLDSVLVLGDFALEQASFLFGIGSD